MIEVFKTNVDEEEQSEMLMNIIWKSFPRFKINFDLDDCDKILRVEGENVHSKKIIELVTSNGFDCTVLV